VAPPEGGSPGEPTSPDADLDEMTLLALAAQQGDRAALEELCRRLQGPMYRLALRFTGQPADAEDAVQEVLVRLVTHLSSFEGRSRFTTWAYTVAVRQLLRTTRRAAETSVAGPDEFAAFLDRHVDDPHWRPEEEVLYQELCAEVRLSCTYGMLLCLTRQARIAYLLGDLLGMSDVEGAQVCETTPAAFRQRLARARATMREVMGRRCGLVRASNPCRCDRLVSASQDVGLLDPARPAFARHRGVDLPIAVDTIRDAAAELDLAVACSEVYRSDPRFSAPVQVWSRLATAMPTLLEHRDPVPGTSPPKSG
jgi:RNA polymerase sigma factor (sigma-70 family)